MNDFELIKEKFDIYEVASRFTFLKKSGKRHVGVCPLHSEKTGSFYVNQAKQRFDCYGCNESGDVIDLISLKENVDSYTALEMLAGEKGIPLSTQDNEGYQRRKEFQRKQSALVKTAHTKSAIKKASDYIFNRGISQESVNKFKLGYGEKNFSIIIPLVDHRNMEIGYAERFIGDPPTGFNGKYRLPSENKESANYNELFRKSEFLFNEYNSRKSLKNEQYLLVFEGQFDAIAADQIGFPAAVAYMQSCLTLEQGKRLIKLAEDNTVIVLVPDKNAAGMLSIKQNFELLKGLNPKQLIKILRLPDKCHENGKEYDMNDFVKEGMIRTEAEGCITIVEIGLIDLMMTQTRDIHLQHEYARTIAEGVENPFSKVQISNYLAECWKTDVEKVDMLLKVKREVSVYEHHMTVDDMYTSFMQKLLSNEVSKLTLGYPDLDRVINSGMGIPTGWVLDFLARSSVGKTAFALNVIANATEKHNVGCSFFSFEQQGSDLYPKISAIQNSLSQKKIFEEYSKGNDMPYHQGVQLDLSEKLIVYEKGRLDLPQMEEFVLTADEKFFETIPQKIVLVDYLGYIKANAINKNKYEALSELTAEIKQAAKRTNKLWIVLVQTSRKGGDGSEPVGFDDARDSGTVEENADILLGAYRPELNKDLGSREIIEVLDDYMIQILKNRNGSSAITCRMKFDKPQQIIRQWYENEKKNLQIEMIEQMQSLNDEDERILYLREGRTSI